MYNKFIHLHDSHALIWRACVICVQSFWIFRFQKFWWCFQYFTYSRRIIQWIRIIIQIVKKYPLDIFFILYVIWFGPHWEILLCFTQKCMFKYLFDCNCSWISAWTLSSLFLYPKISLASNQHLKILTW